MEYKVTKQHWGDKQYFEGDTREVKNDSDAKELLRMGLIIDPKAAAAEKKKRPLMLRRLQKKLKRKPPTKHRLTRKLQRLRLMLNKLRKRLNKLRKRLVRQRRQHLKPKTRWQKSQLTNQSKPLCLYVL